MRERAKSVLRHIWTEVRWNTPKFHFYRTSRTEWVKHPCKCDRPEQVSVQVCGWFGALNWRAYGVSREYYGKLGRLGSAVRLTGAMASFVYRSRRGR